MKALRHAFAPPIIPRPAYYAPRYSAEWGYCILHSSSYPRAVIGVILYRLLGYDRASFLMAHVLHKPL